MPGKSKGHNLSLQSSSCRGQAPQKGSHEEEVIYRGGGGLSREPLLGVCVPCGRVVCKSSPSSLGHVHRSTKVMGQGSAGKQGPSAALYTKCDSRGEWEYVQWEDFGLFSSHYTGQK